MFTRRSAAAGGRATTPPKATNFKATTAAYQHAGYFVPAQQEQLSSALGVTPKLEALEAELQSNPETSGLYSSACTSAQQQQGQSVVTPILTQDPPASSVIPPSVSSSEGIPKRPWIKKGITRNKQQLKRRLNAKLRKLLRPKNPLLILNELKINPTFKVTPKDDYSPFHHVTLQVGDKIFEGTGGSVNGAKMDAAEKIIKDLIVEKLEGLNNDGSDEEEKEENGHQSADDGLKKETEGAGEDGEPVAKKKTNLPKEDDFPWNVVGSYAVLKLLESMRKEGRQVPASIMDNLGVGLHSFLSLSKKEKKTTKANGTEVREVPAVMLTSHPTSIVNYMVPGLKFTEVVIEKAGGGCVHFETITSLQGTVFLGEAPSKKDAKRICCLKILKHYNVPYNGGAALEEQVAPATAIDE